MSKLRLEDFNSYDEYIKAVNEQSAEPTVEVPDKNEPSANQKKSDPPSDGATVETASYFAGYNRNDAQTKVPNLGNVYRHPAFDKAMNEHFDITDTNTRRVLLAVNEADQEKILTSLTSKLYDNIMDKFDDIDFGEIPASKGDITKIPNYGKLKECVEILEGILTQFKQPTKPIDTISNAIENVKLRKELFEKAFRYNIELPAVMYDTMVLAIISSVSLMISTCIEFIKIPSQDGFDIVLDKVALNKTKEHMLFVNLEKFNQTCKTGDFDRAMEFVISNRVKNLTGTVATGMMVGVGVATIGMLLSIIPLLRELIFFFYYSRTRVSDYFDAQADLLQMNAHNIEVNSTLDKEEKQKVIKRQMKIVDFFRKISNKIAVTAKESEVKATKEITNSNKKYKTDDLLDEIPDSAASALF